MVSVGVLVVDASCRAMIDAPDGKNASRFALLVCEGKVRKGVERKSNVLKSSCFVGFGAGTRDGADGDTMMLVVVCEERQECVLVRCSGAQKGFVEFHHGGEFSSP